MRNIRLSRSFLEAFDRLLSQGEERFGPAIAAAKRLRVREMIEKSIAPNPAIKSAHPVLKLRLYPIRGTPFVIVYDFDDEELRVHFIFHRHDDLRDLDPASAVW